MFLSKIFSFYSEFWPFLRFSKFYTILHYNDTWNADFTLETENYATYDICTERAREDVEDDIGID